MLDQIVIKLYQHFASRHRHMLNHMVGTCYENAERSCAFAAWCGLVRCGQELHLRTAAAPHAIVTDVLALVADRNVGSPGASLVDIFDMQRAPVTWFDDLPLAGEGLEWADKLDCSIATGLAVALARRENQPLLSFDPRLTQVPDLTVLRLPRTNR